MSKHTEGPWEVRERFYIGRPGKLSLAEVKCGDIPADDTEQHEANARLISAAPDLLEACQALLAADHPDHFVVRLSDSEMTALDAIKAAIAKATASPATTTERSDVH